MPIITIDDLNISYQVKGTGIPIVFIHPPLLTKENFAYQLEDLSEQFQIIIFDIRGHGQSESANKKLTYSLIVEDIIGLMDHIGVDKAYLCGYSTGGTVALEGMLNYPDRFLGGILLSAMSEVSSIGLKTEIALALKLTSNNKYKKIITHMITKRNADNKQTLKTLYQAALLGDIAKWNEYYRTSQKYNVTARLPEIKAPMLLIYGEVNKQFHSYAYKLKEKLPNQQFYMLKGEKHHLPTKSANKIHEIIRQWIKVNVK